MHFVPSNIYHIYNRGNNRQEIFFNKENYLFFLKKLKQKLIFHCHILAWCLMPNHFHLMIYFPENKSSDSGHSLNKAIAIVLRSYAQAINKQQDRTGSLFQQKTKAKLLTENEDADYPLVCFHYIHQNPLRANLVERLEDWEFSSFRDYAGLREGTLVDKALAYKFMDIPTNPLAFHQQSYQTVTPDKIDRIL